MGYRFIDHTADCGIQVVGADLNQLFENAAYALFDLITDTSVLEFRNERRIQVSGFDCADLMVNWLRALLDLWVCEEKLVKEVQIQELAEYQLTARIRMDDFDMLRHCLNREIKAVTYHHLQVSPNPDGWQATLVFDV